MMGKLLLCFQLALYLILNKTFNMNLFNLHYLFQTFLTIPYIATLKLPTPKRQKNTIRNRFLHEVFATIGLVIVLPIEVLLSFLNTWLFEKLFLVSRAI